MIKKRLWLWVILFVSSALLLSILATGWNVVLVRYYQQIHALSRYLPTPDEIDFGSTHLIIRMTLGTLGFVAVLTLTILLFVKLVTEMRLNQQQSEFLATVSHELKTPLAALELSSSLLKAGGLDQEEVTRLWNSHQVELNRLRDEVDALLAAARWQAKPSLKERKSILLETWLSESLEYWKSILGPNSSLSREGSLLTCHTLADTKSLKLVVDNLMSNARKFSKESPQVIIRTRRIPKKNLISKNKWQLEIEDSGWGFEPQDSKRLFQRFFRAKTTAPYAIPGTGLGLYLAFTASKAMGISLKGHSRGPGLGATFTLEGNEL